MFIWRNISITLIAIDRISLFQKQLFLEHSKLRFPCVQIEVFSGLKFVWFLAHALSELQYGYNSKSQIQLEKKEGMKSRDLASPELGDMLAMTLDVTVLPKLKLAAPCQASAWN
jgi:hypothetical protein